MRPVGVLVVLALVTVGACGSGKATPGGAETPRGSETTAPLPPQVSPPEAPVPSKSRTQKKQTEEALTTATATFGGGCFWCVEAVFELLDGVTDVVSGYSGGPAPNPTYEQICAGTTGHAEVCQIHYNPDEVSFEALLEVFFRTHDPTTRNRQGNDVGTQYRSVVLYSDAAQKEIATKIVKELNGSGAWDDPVVTEVAALDTFWPAEAYHQDYFARNPTQGYCAAIIAPKVAKFEKVFRDKLKK
jgi:peptide-methionine (S)-S-oxide reductase